MLGLVVGARPVGPDAQVCDAEFGERLAVGMGCLGRAVVGHDGADRDARLCKPGEFWRRNAVAQLAVSVGRASV